MATRGAAIRYDDSELREGIARLREAGQSPRPIMRRVGRYFAEQTRRNFRDARSLYPPKPAHWAEWQGSSTPLSGKSKNLARSITYDLPSDTSTRVGSPLPYAAAQQFGADTGKAYVVWILPKRTARGTISRFKNGLPHGKLVTEGTEGAVKVLLRQRIRPRPFLNAPDPRQQEQIRRICADGLERALGGGS